MPGLLLVLSFISCVLIRAVKAIKQASCPLGIWMLAAIILSMLIGDLAECFVWLRPSHCLVNTVFFPLASLVQKSHTIEHIT